MISSQLMLFCYKVNLNNLSQTKTTLYLKSLFGYLFGYVVS